MSQILFVFAIVACAALYLGRGFWKSCKAMTGKGTGKRKGSCSSCGCGQQADEKLVLPKEPG